MGLFDALKGGANAKTLYRREWQETNNPVVREARAQTLAIQRLQVWLRLAYSVLTLAVLLGYWGFYENGGIAIGVVAAILGVLAFLVVIVLRTGIANGRKNVNAMLDSLQEQSKEATSQ